MTSSRVVQQAAAETSSRVEQQAIALEHLAVVRVSDDLATGSGSAAATSLSEPEPGPTFPWDTV